MSKIELPPEPKPTFLWDRPEYPHFTASQLRARDRQILELCARLCEQHAVETPLRGKKRLAPADSHEASEAMHDGQVYAAAIRNLIEGANNG